MFYRIDGDFFTTTDLSKLECPIHVVTNRAIDLTTPAWIKSEIFFDGKYSEISLLDGTWKLFPEMCKEIIDKIYQLSLKKIIVNVEDIRIIKTTGNVLPHRDQIRKSCINILINSEIATTMFSVNNSFDDYRLDPINVKKFVCRQGEIYLLDTKNVHSVQQDHNSSRYLISVSFMKTYNEILNIFTDQ